MNYSVIRSLALLALLVLAACGRNESATTQAVSSAPPEKRTSLVASAVASADRVAGDSAEDEWRRPKAILEFMGVEPGMQVLDYFAASGYYSELLSRSVGPAGSVIVYNNPGYAQFAGEKLTKRFENSRLPNAKVMTI